MKQNVPIWKHVVEWARLTGVRHGGCSVFQCRGRDRRLVRAGWIVETEASGACGSAGLVLAEPLAADRDSPPSDVSSMDGYAVRLGDWFSAPLPVRGECLIGRPEQECNRHGHAHRHGGGSSGRCRCRSAPGGYHAGGWRRGPGRAGWGGRIHTAARGEPAAQVDEVVPELEFRVESFR